MNNQVDGDSPKNPVDLPHTVVEIAELAGGLAHELRNPLSTMMITLRLMAEELRDARASSDDVRRRSLIKVETLQREADRLQTLFDEFLALVGPCRIQRRPCDLMTLIRRLIEFFEPMASSRGINLTIEGNDDLPSIQADETLLSRALLNLMLNAQQAMPHGGRLTLGAVVRGPDAWLTVQDTGEGIPIETRPHVFRPFFSTKSGGTGLGLSLSQRVIREHGGEITLDCPDSGGTILTIRLPTGSPHSTPD